MNEIVWNIGKPKEGIHVVTRCVDGENIVDTSYYSEIYGWECDNVVAWYSIDNIKPYK